MYHTQETMNRLLNLRMMKKKFERQSKICEKNSLKERNKCKKYMATNDAVRARMYGGYAIEKHEESLTYLQQSFVIERVMRQYEKLLTNGNMTRHMDLLTKEMSTLFNSETTALMYNKMNVLMKSNEDMQMQTEMMNHSSEKNVSIVNMDEKVDSFMRQVSEENDIELNAEFYSVKPSTVTTNDAKNKIEKDDIAGRLERLKR